ncbi:hypothetical protein [Phenylobacterium sp.]|uniref:hypothetical protein n=1 Tax=Phenylobacterium sp. TaxID=1871053 RepID=UPI00394BBBBC
MIEKIVQTAKAAMKAAVLRPRAARAPGCEVAVVVFTGGGSDGQDGLSSTAFCDGSRSSDLMNVNRVDWKYSFVPDANLQGGSNYIRDGASKLRSWPRLMFIKAYDRWKAVELISLKA